MSENGAVAAKKAHVKAITIRMAKAYGVETKKLANTLGCNRNVISNWSYYGRIPYQQIVRCKEQTGRSVDWLLFGEESANGQLNPQIVSELKLLLVDLLSEALDFSIIDPLTTDAEEGLLKRLDSKLGKWQEGKFEGD